MGNGNEAGGFCENHCDLNMFCVLLLVLGALEIHTVNVNTRVCKAFCGNGGGSCLRDKIES